MYTVTRYYSATILLVLCLSLFPVYPSLLYGILLKSRTLYVLGLTRSDQNFLFSLVFCLFPFLSLRRISGLSGIFKQHE